MAKKKFKPRKVASYVRRSKNLEDRSAKRAPLIVFSFKDLDRNQGQSFKEWEENDLLAAACEKLAGISSLTVAQALQKQILKIYTKIDFPPNSKFTHPRHVPDDVKWASMHI